VTSPNQHPELHVEDSEKDQSKGDDDRISTGDLNLGAHTDQHTIAVGKYNASSGNKSNPVDNSSKDATPMINIQTMNVAMSQEELDQLEKNNPLEAFDFLVKSDVLFSKSTGKSSDISTDDPSETSKENLLAEFQSKMLGIDLFEAIEQDDNIISEVKELLHKLSKLPPGSRFQEFSQTPEPLMDGINQSFEQKKTDQSKLEEETQHCDQLRAEVATFQEKLDTFRQEIPYTQQKVAEIDSTIAKYKAEIQNLEL